MLAGGAGNHQTVAEGVLVARDLTPAQAAGLDISQVQGIVLAAGSPTSHAAILARSRGDPARRRRPAATCCRCPRARRSSSTAPPARSTSTPSRRWSTTTWPGPPTWPSVVPGTWRSASEPAVTRDGTRIVVAANLGSVVDARAAFAAGADEAGLVRTEFLFLGRERAAGRSRSRRRSTPRSPRRSAAGARRCARSTSAATSRCPTCRCRPRTTRSSGSAESASPSTDRVSCATSWSRCARWPVGTPTSVMFPMVSTVGELLRRAVGARSRPPARTACPTGCASG